MSAYYNECDPYATQWLRNLIAAGEIPAGDVDDRPIEEVSADDVRPYTQAHFFAGIGGWAYALRLAGWDGARPVWTGSCPCQPFSNAGKRLAYDDPRNLWPEWLRLIRECMPVCIAGEQVASKAGRLWLHGVKADVQSIGYEFGAADLPAAAVGAPHIRQRIWFVGELQGARPPIPAQMENEESSAGLGEACQTQGRGGGNTVRPGQPHRRTTSTDRLGILRDNGSSFHDGYAEIVRQSIAGSDRSGQGVCVHQHQGDLFADESSAGSLGGGHITPSDENLAGEVEYGPTAPIEPCSCVSIDERKTGTRIPASLEIVGRLDSSIAGVGAPHIRQRLWWVADAVNVGCERDTDAGRKAVDRAELHSVRGGLAEPDEQRVEQEGHTGHVADGREPGRVGADAARPVAAAGGDCGLEQPNERGRSPRGLHVRPGRPHETAAFKPWAGAVWIPCADGKARRIKPGIEPLVDRTSFAMDSGSPLQGKSRTDMLRAYGNAIVPQVAKEFISAYMEIT